MGQYLGEYSGSSLHAYSILMLYSLFSSSCCQKPDAGFHRPVVKQAFLMFLKDWMLAKIHVLGRQQRFM